MVLCYVDAMYVISGLKCDFEFFLCLPFPVPETAGLEPPTLTEIFFSINIRIKKHRIGEYVFYEKLYIRIPQFLFIRHDG